MGTWGISVAVTLAVIGCTSKPHDASVAEGLVHLLEEQQTATREWRDTVDRLVKLGPTAVPFLIDGLGSDSLDCTTGSRAALLRIAESREPLEKALLDTKRLQRVRIACAEALQQLGNTRSLEAILKAAADADPSIRRFATLALGAQPDNRAFEFLVARLKDPDRHIAGAAASALGMRHDKAATPYMLAALRERNDNSKYAIVPALGGLRDPAAVPVLGQFARGDDPQLKVAAVEALGLTGGPAAVALLESLIDDPNTGLALDAIWALGRRDSVEARAVLSRKAESTSEPIRRAAQRALRAIESAPE